jgi:hypothetical protein
MCFMSKVSRESAPDVTDYGPAEDRGAHLDGYVVIFTSIREDWDLTPLLKGLPGDSCQCPHWGYVTAGSPSGTATAKMEAAMRELMMQKGNGNGSP